MEPPCHKCRVELHRDNIPYYTVYEYVQDQVIMSQVGAVALRMDAIKQALIDFNVPEDEHIDFSTTVRRLANAVFNERNLRTINDMKQQQGK